MPPDLNFSKTDMDTLVELIATQAANAIGVGPQGYFKDLVSRTTLKPNFRLSLSGVWTGNPLVDARALVNWAVSKPVNPADGRFTTLGSFLQELLKDVDLTGQRTLVALIIGKTLYLDADLLNGLKAEYNVPGWAAPDQKNDLPTEGRAFIPSNEDLEDHDIGPDFEWWGEKSELELQSWLRPKPEYEDVGELIKVIDRAASVCRIVIPNLEFERLGTGCLVAPNLVLTNYHVFKQMDGEDLLENGRHAELYFGKVSLGDGHEADGRKFMLVAEKPVLESSPVDQLDFVLLQVEQTVKYEQTIRPSPCSIQVPVKKDALNILQHPQGLEMKLARSGDGVAAVREDLGLVQYYTLAASGSSGAPCYNSKWELVAIHHAERSMGAGVRREGILFKAIHEKIAQYL